MRTSGHYAEYHGTTYREISSDATTVVVAVPDQDVDSITEAVESGVGRKGGWVRLPKAALGPRTRVRVWVDWQGERFTLARLDEGSALLQYDGGDEARARELGMVGSNYDGWSITVPVEEIEHVETEERQFA